MNCTLNFYASRNIEMFSGTQEKFRKFRSRNKQFSVNYVTSYQSFKIRGV